MKPTFLDKVIKVLGLEETISEAGALVEITALKEKTSILDSIPIDGEIVKLASNGMEKASESFLNAVRRLEDDPNVKWSSNVEYIETTEGLKRVTHKNASREGHTIYAGNYIGGTPISDHHFYKDCYPTVFIGFSPEGILKFCEPCE